MPLIAMSGEGEYTGAFKRALEQVHPLLLEELRGQARSLGWPEDLVQSLYLAMNGGKLVVSVPDDVAERVWDEEYGDTSRTPKPAVRKFAESTDWHPLLIAASLQEVGA